jgi:hypothetical protein
MVTIKKRWLSEPTNYFSDAPAYALTTRPVIDKDPDYLKSGVNQDVYHNYLSTINQFNFERRLSPSRTNQFFLKGLILI